MENEKVRNPTDKEVALKAFEEFLESKSSTKQNTKRVSKVQIDTMTKMWTNRLLWFSCAWISLSYVLAFMDKTQVATDLSIQVVTVIVGTFMSYVVRGFFDTYFEKRQSAKQQSDTTVLENSNISTDDNSAG